MISAGIRDLKNNLSRYLRGLRPGDVIAITDRGRIVAELRAPSSQGSASAAPSPLTGGTRDSWPQASSGRRVSPGIPSATWKRRAGGGTQGTVAALIREDRGD